ncbi:hypothetical protein U1Q18_006410 [Sarracenia purpurea var. burkii]
MPLLAKFFNFDINVCSINLGIDFIFLYGTLNYQRRAWRGRIGRRSGGVSRRGSSGSPKMVDGDCAIEGDNGFSGGNFEGKWCLAPWVGGDGGSPEKVAGGVCRHQSKGRR